MCNYVPNWCGETDRGEGAIYRGADPDACLEKDDRVCPSCGSVKSRSYEWQQAPSS